jgi:hypothetical protein
LAQTGAFVAEHWQKQRLLRRVFGYDLSKEHANHRQPLAAANFAAFEGNSRPATTLCRRYRRARRDGSMRLLTKSRTAKSFGSARRWR